MSDEEEEVYVVYEEEEEVEDSSSDELVQLVSESSNTFITKEIESFSHYLPNWSAYSSDNRMIINIPSSFLPLAQKVVYGFSVHDILLNLTITMNSNDWTTPPQITFEHPIYKSQFIGRPLIVDLIPKFFNKDYKPKQNYRAAGYVLNAAGHADPELVKLLAKEGISAERAKTALVLCRNKINDARSFLRTGQKADVSTRMPCKFEECRLLYFIVEICDLFIGLQDHCCFCGKKLSEATVKPSVCSNKLCNFSFTQLGVGTSLLQEIRRDPDVADLMISCFATALGTAWLKPKPNNFTDDEMRQIINGLPTVSDMVRANDDHQLANLVGDKAILLLNWIILSNKSQLYELSPELRLKQFPTRHQFLTLMASEERENEFKALKAKYGSFFLWHGSTGDRWHSIIRNGLKNGTGTEMQQNGKVFGSGIYLASELLTSLNYVKNVQNEYARSTLGNSLQAVGLCEVAKVPDLEDHGRAYTLMNEKAIVVRFLFVGANFSYDVVQKPLERVPKLKDILNYHASLNK
ncbi:UBA/TS-N domain containing protein [Trichomonas vaginalis G3]|uniref:UBA/TS-N domain containing protein n=1 Tax=Trichomonas vaginalis (strain ATCC PRA-98 / G3) TaxID=412133 RepID=A2ER66_TRIV3|nr:poly ADP-ribose polymerase family, member PARP family [Trichomonas vaginalis G3]EAY04819.1 UBA/TS-N domain containing protein [Trichomonas vaginalis G3]KAI5535339.1 poly ADP-ribose polymerase family, member PARP family [Trichomonas vaginalis G3]|eukprot:XP_001317042.1 UBA/TS-N domain containing protein [Trichomonas vaginalis G3]